MPVKSVGHFVGHLPSLHRPPLSPYEKPPDKPTAQAYYLLILINGEAK